MLPYEAQHDFLDAYAYYDDLMYRMTIASKIRATLPSRSNSLESYSRSETALRHYTDIATQPWISTVNPLGYLWVRMLFDAVDEGFVTTLEVETEVRAGHIRPWFISSRIVQKIRFCYHARQGKWISALCRHTEKLTSMVRTADVRFGLCSGRRREWPTDGHQFTNFSEE